MRLEKSQCCTRKIAVTMPYVLFLLFSGEESIFGVLVTMPHRAFRKQIEEEERNMDPDLRDSTTSVIAWVLCVRDCISGGVCHV